MAGQAFLSRRQWLLIGTLMIVVSSLTVAERERLIPLSDLASSPHAIAEARLRSLVTSALLVSYSSPSGSRNGASRTRTSGLSETRRARRATFVAT